MDSDLTLPPRLDTASAPALADRLGDLRGGPVRIDASKVVFAGALGLQVLVSACQTWRKDRHEFEVLTPSDGFKMGAEILGIDAEALGIPESQEVVS